MLLRSKTHLRKRENQTVKVKKKKNNIKFDPLDENFVSREFRNAVCLPFRSRAMAGAECRVFRHYGWLEEN